MKAAPKTHLWISTNHRNGAVFIHVVRKSKRRTVILRLTVEEADDLVGRLQKSADGAANRKPIPIRMTFSIFGAS